MAKPPWGNEIVGFSDPEHARVLVSDPESEKYKHLPFRSPVSQEVFDYGRELAADRRGGDGTDLASQLVNKIPENGQAMSASEYDSYFLFSWSRATRPPATRSRHTMLALIENPDQLAKLQANPNLISDAVEEFLHWASPASHFRACRQIVWLHTIATS